MQLDLMCKRNILIRNGEKYKLSEKGEKFFSSIYNFTSTEGRKKYLKACTEALLTIPLPILTNSIGKESMIMDLNKTPRRELLGNGISINLLYKDFKGLKSVLGENSTDLWIVSTLWIKYLNNIAERGGNID